MLRNVMLLTLLGLCCGQPALDTDEDLSKLLQEVFGAPPSNESTVDKDIDTGTCQNTAGLDGKCVSSSSCITSDIQDILVCEAEDDVCCSLDNIKTKCGYGYTTKNSPRVLSKGDTTAYAEYPWIVAVLQLVPSDDGSSSMMMVFTCSGSLIHPKVVMTTAHNIQNLTNLRIRAGEWDTTTTDEIYPHQERDVANIIRHEAFNTKRQNMHNDIALLVLKDPVDMKPNINTLCLPSELQRPAPATKCFSSGWGKNNFDKKGVYQNILKKVELPVIQHFNCQKQLRRTRLGRFFRLHRSLMCAGGIAGRDTCTGDGGSPLMCPVPGESGRFMASGMVSWGIGCGNTYPAVYADVAYLKPWVDKKMAELGYPTDYYTI